MKSDRFIMAQKVNLSLSFLTKCVVNGLIWKGNIYDTSKEKDISWLPDPWEAWNLFLAFSLGLIRRIIPF